MRNLVQLKRVFWGWLVLLWSATAYAAQSTFAEGMQSIPLDAIGWTVALAFIGGAAGTTNKMARPDIVIRNMWLEMTKDMLCSLLVGMLTFFISSWTGVSFWIQAFMISLAGYGGSRAMDYYLENGLFKWFDKISGNISDKSAGEKP